MDDVVLNKVASIERCLARVREEYAGHGDGLAQDYTRQDAIILNLLRACETSIDLAMHVVRRQQLGVPQASRDAFERLRAHGMIDEPIARAMQRMVGFRNIAVHQYRELEIPILCAIVEERLGDFEAFTGALLRA